MHVCDKIQVCELEKCGFCRNINWCTKLRKPLLELVEHKLEEKRCG